MSIKPPADYAQYLPAIYRDHPVLSQFLALFDASINELDSKIAATPSYFAPDRTPREFLDWLAGWVALTLRQDWTEQKQRALINTMHVIYPIRGTRAGLEMLLGIYVGRESGDPVISIQEQLSPFQIGIHSTVGVDTFLGGGMPHHFTVRIDFPTWKSAFLTINQQAITDIVDLEKPAHPYYTLEVLIPAFQVGVRSHVGVDTVLGNKTV